MKQLYSDILIEEDSRVKSDNSEECYFDGLCMIPGKSWNAQMELEHWNRYMTFLYLAESANILDAACGEGYGTNLLSSIAQKAIGIDLSNSNIRHAVNKYGQNRTNLNYIVSDACHMSVVDEKFDVIYSFETIEHLDDIQSFLLSMSNIIEDNGIGIISTPKPNINPVTKKPYNPHHVNELSTDDFKSYLGTYFQYVEIAGQSREFPCEIHQVFDNNYDAYAIGIVSNVKEKVDKVIKRLPDKEILSIRENLFKRHCNRVKNFVKPLRILFVPLENPECINPADRRRVLLPANYLRDYGTEVAIVKKEDTLKIKSNIILTQNRDYQFWLDNIDKYRKDGRHLFFSFSDALGISTKSKTHSYEAFCNQEIQTNILCTDSILKSFMEKCCSHIFAGSVIQKQIISELAPGVSVSVLNDPIDTLTYNADLAGRREFHKDNVMTIIWEGFCDNVPYLLVCAEAIHNLSKKIPLRVIVTTSQYRRNEFLGTKDNKELAQKILGDVIDFHVWSRQKISSLMASADVGLAPAFINCNFAQAKPSNKAIIYNYMKLPVICSPTTAYESYIQNDFNGFIANTQSDWENYIEYLYKYPEHRQRIGVNGHKKAKEGYNVEAISKQMLRVFMDVV
jgi:2-polyprenyl-3-methyl-5-hydroxy-6-metoxy-1,4-benzoquinol methylase